MNASSFTDWRISCDHPGCGKQVWASQTMARDATATSLRSELKRHGWMVNVPAPRRPVGRLTPRLYFCPDHKPNPEG